MMFTTIQISLGLNAITFQSVLIRIYHTQGLSAGRHRPIKSPHGNPHLEGSLFLQNIFIDSAERDQKYLWFVCFGDTTEFRFCFPHKHHGVWNFEANNCKRTSLILSVTGMNRRKPGAESVYFCLWLFRYLRRYTTKYLYFRGYST